MAYESLELDSRLSTDAIARTFQTAIRESNAKATIGRIEVAEGRTDAYAAFASGKTLSSQWCVQIYIREDGATRHIQLAILGSSTLAKAWQGTRNTHSLSAGRLRAVAVIDALKEAERSS